jgi:hypothetical protein
VFQADLDSPWDWPCCYLTRRRGEVLVLECLGLTHSEIAGALGIASATVDKTTSTVWRAVVPPYLSASRPRATAWGWAHRACCLVPFWAGRAKDRGSREANA